MFVIQNHSPHAHHQSRLTKSHHNMAATTSSIPVTDTPLPNPCHLMTPEELEAQVPAGWQWWLRILSWLADVLSQVGRCHVLDHLAGIGAIAVLLMALVSPFLLKFILCKIWLIGQNLLLPRPKSVRIPQYPDRELERLT